MNTTNHGGPRQPGPGKHLGRPRKADPKRPISFRLAPDLVDWLKQQPNQGMAVEKALRAHCGPEAAGEKTEFELQSGDGTSVEIVGDGFWLIVGEDDLVRMIKIAFDCKEFTINHLIDALRVASPETEE